MARRPVKLTERPDERMMGRGLGSICRWHTDTIPHPSETGATTFPRRQKGKPAAHWVITGGSQNILRWVCPGLMTGRRSPSSDGGGESTVGRDGSHTGRLEPMVDCLDRRIPRHIEREQYQVRNTGSKCSADARVGRCEVSTAYPVCNSSIGSRWESIG